MKIFVILTLSFVSLSSFADCIDDYYQLLTARIVIENYYNSSEPDPIDCVDTIHYIKKNLKRDRELVELELKNYRELKTKFDYFQVGMSYQEICKEEMGFVSTPEINPLPSRFKKMVDLENPKETCEQILKHVSAFKKDYFK